ncbi:DUF4250 domain-containing protein [Verrucomicrobiales bacterium BCK34]|nr:DUF4250 domain-containing protein [Verrucomicrobiales bacterium BCK34]
MNLSSYETMDPHLLVGLINTALRNDCDSLDDLVKTHDLDQSALEERLRTGGYQYISDLNQFRPVDASR